MPKILFADDDEDLRKWAVFTLRKEGHEVIECADGAEAKLLIDREMPDLVISDTEMPHHDGYEVVEHAFMHVFKGKAIPTIQISGDDINVEKSHATHKLLKPFGTNELLALVTYVFETEAARKAPTPEPQ